MRGEEKQEGFSYWKRPWHKWLILAAAVLQLLCLWMNIQEYHSISAAGILSASQWADYAASKIWQCAMNGVMLTCFFGTFLIGVFVQSQRAARLAEGVLLLLLSFAWGAAGFALHLFSPDLRGLFGVLILLIAFGGAVYDLWRCRKK